jgi:DNA topoisomerase-2
VGIKLLRLKENKLNCLKKRQVMEPSKKYVKFSPKEHVLNRPAMYIGSIEECVGNFWIIDSKTGLFNRKSIDFVPGLYKIFDEMIVNACDHVIRQQNTENKVKNIKVTIDKITGIISVYNDGDGIEIYEDIEHEIYIPELLFGNLLSSTNFDDTEERIIGGMNGIGSKACNIFSESFQIETVDHSRSLIYIQKWENNMEIMSKPKIKKCIKKPYTMFTFKPDYAKFGLENLTDDMYSVLEKRVYDVCIIPGTSVFFNDTKLPIKNLQKYAEMYLPNSELIHDKCNDRWEIVIGKSESGFECVSFVNGICTFRNGKHVDYVLSIITKKLTELIVKRHKDINIKNSVVKENLFLFVNCTIVNPVFDSQSKETLITNMTRFGSKCEISDKTIEKLYKILINDLLEASKSQVSKELKKTDGTKRTSLSGIKDLDDANLAGGRHSSKCTLILTEGLSAKALAVSGLAVVSRDYYGIFPLRGKLLNVRDVSSRKLLENEEISNLKKILGLETGKVYTDVSQLRYGRILILSDQDLDGSHIKGLIINLFDVSWNELLKLGFIVSMLTPIIKAKCKSKVIEFYSIQDYNEWQNTVQNDLGSWTIKYFKGLGTSTSEEAKSYFKAMKLVNYKWNENTETALDLAFNKKKADERKTWLSNYDKNKTLNYSNTEVSFDDFINLDLIHYSVYDIARSIPSLIDGLKVSQRKIMYACFKRNLWKDEIKVAQLSGNVSEVSCYHHGENSLQSAIINMAQDYPGSNNINYLFPSGQFGTRLYGGKDSASARYIFTRLNTLIEHVFIKEDNNVLEYLTDDGMIIEPEYYVPIIPMILVNGASGIGTGYSTNIPMYNPRDLINVLIDLIDNKNVDDIKLVPWYKGFKGTVQLVDNKYVSFGNFEIVRKLLQSNNSRGKAEERIEITELPLFTWTSDYKTFLEELQDKGIIKSFVDNSTDTTVYFAIVLNGMDNNNSDDDITKQNKIIEMLKLSSNKNLSTSNMHLFDKDHRIKKYESPIEIIKEFYKVRLFYFQKRKDFLIQQLDKELNLLQNKTRFLDSVNKKVIKLESLSKSELEMLLSNSSYDMNDGSFNYLTGIPLYNLNIDKILELKTLESLKSAKREALLHEDIKIMWKHELNVLMNKL